MEKFLIGKIPGIYGIVNNANGKFYIGSSINLESRFKQHLRSLRKGDHYTKPLQYAFNKYGEENFSFEFIEHVPDKTKLIQREQFWVDFLNPDYNIMKIMVNSNYGMKQSQETINKTKSRLKILHPSDRCVLCINTGIFYKSIKEAFFYHGHCYSKHVTAFNRDINKARVPFIFSDEIRRKSNYKEKVKRPRISSMLGKKHSEETRKKLSESHKGYVMPEAQKLKISDAHKNRVRTSEEIEKNRTRFIGNTYQGKSIVNIENGIVYDTMLLAFEAYGREMNFKTFRSRVEQGKIQYCLADALNTYTKRTEYKKELKTSKQIIVLNTENGIYYDSVKEAYGAYGAKMTREQFLYRLKGGIKERVDGLPIKNYKFGTTVPFVMAGRYHDNQFLQK